MAEDPRPGYLALSVGAVGASMSALLYKLTLSTGLHPVWINVLRLWLTLLIMVPGLALRLRRREASKRFERRDVYLAWAAGLLLALHLVSWTYALGNTEAFAATSIWSTYLLLTAIGSWLILREPLAHSAVWGLLLATAGVVVCNLGGGAGRLPGNLLALAAALTQAGYTLCGRSARRRMDAYPYTLMVYSSCALVLLVWALALRLPLAGLGAGAVGGALGLAILCTLGGHTMMNIALRYLKAPTVSAVMLTEVITGPLVVFLVLGEAPTPLTLLGGAIILAGLGYYLIRENRARAQ